MCDLAHSRFYCWITFRSRCNNSTCLYILCSKCLTFWGWIDSYRQHYQQLLEYDERWGEGDTAIWRWNVKWWFRWLIWNVCKHGPRWDSEWIVISSYLHCALSTIILHHPTTAARYARKLLLSYLKIFIVETKPANKAWRGREVEVLVGVSVSAVLQSCVWMGLHWITAHTILLRTDWPWDRGWTIVSISSPHNSLPPQPSSDRRRRGKRKNLTCWQK